MSSGMVMAGDYGLVVVGARELRRGVGSGGPSYAESCGYLGAVDKADSVSIGQSEVLVEQYLLSVGDIYPRALSFLRNHQVRRQTQPFTSQTSGMSSQWYRGDTQRSILHRTDKPTALSRGKSGIRPSVTRSTVTNLCSHPIRVSGKRHVPLRRDMVWDGG